MADVGDHLRVGAAAGDQRRRIGGQVVQQQEGDERDAEQDGERLDEPLREQAAPSAAPPLRRVEQVAQRVADEVEGERGRQDDRRRE